MKLVIKEDINNYIASQNLSLNAIGLFNSILTLNNKDLENIDLYSISKRSRKDVALAFRELRKKKYIIYNSVDDTYYIYASPQNN